MEVHHPRARMGSDRCSSNPEQDRGPVCFNPKILAGFNDLQSTHPGIAQEANFDPTTVVDGTVLDRWYRTGLFFCLRVTTRSSRRRWEWAQELMMGLFTKKVNGYVLGPGATLGGKRW